MRELLRQWAERILAAIITVMVVVIFFWICGSLAIDWLVKRFHGF